MIRLLALFILVSSACFAGTYEKNGLPCVDELCIGDSIVELKKIKWEPYQYRKKNASELGQEWVAIAYRGNITPPLAFSLHKGIFDSDDLNLLEGITAYCDNKRNWNMLEGVYKSKNGLWTTVQISLEGITDPKQKPRWIVVLIKRNIDSKLTATEIATAQLKISERYEQFNITDERGFVIDKPEEAALVSFSNSLNDISYTLYEQISDSKRQDYVLSDKCKRDIPL